MLDRKIRIDYVHPPIPIRNCDYQASYEDSDPNDQQCGFGETPEEATKNLLEWLPQCDICGDVHENEVPYSCQTGDGV